MQRRPETRAGFADSPFLSILFANVFSKTRLDSGWSVRSTTGSTLQPSVNHSPSVSPYASSCSLSITPSPSCADMGAGASGNQVTSSISEEEQAKILSVISRAKRVEQMERDRIQ
jgi:hypothetical protein